MSSEIIKENAQPEEPQAVHHTSFVGASEYIGYTVIIV